MKPKSPRTEFHLPHGPDLIRQCIVDSGRLLYTVRKVLADSLYVTDDAIGKLYVT